MPPKAQAPVEFSQEVLFDVPVIDAVPPVKPVDMGAAPVAMLTTVEPVATHEQLSLDDALRDQAAMPQRAVLGSRAKKWMTTIEQTEAVVATPAPGYRERGLAENDTIAMKSIENERARQARGRDYRLNNSHQGR